MRPLWLEIIGSADRAFVTEVELVNGSVAERKIKPAMVDYAGMNSVGSRGIMHGYLLREGQLYHVSAPSSWKRTENYYCAIEGGQMVRVTAQGVLEWASRV